MAVSACARTRSAGVPVAITRPWSMIVTRASSVVMLTTRERLGLGIEEPVQVECDHGFVDSLRELVALDAGEPGKERDVLSHRLGRVDPGLLRSDAEQVPRPVGMRESIDVTNLDRAGILGAQPGHDRNEVVLPAPLTPSKPTISPAAVSTSTPSRAGMSP